MSEIEKVTNLDALRRVVAEHAELESFTTPYWMCPSDGSRVPHHFPCETLNSLAEALGVTVRDLVLLVADDPDSVPAETIRGEVVDFD